MLRAVDLFSGAGGFTRGLIDAGIDVVLAVDNWGPAVSSYSANFDHPILNAGVSGDPAFLEPLKQACGEIDLLVGGPPCQGFSIQRIGVDADERNALVLAYAQAVIHLKPRVFLMENVPGLLGARGKDVIRDFSRLVRAAGYGLKHQILDAAAYGVPQNRRRVIFIGWRDDVAEVEFPSPTHDASSFHSVMDAIGDLPEPPADYSSLTSDRLHRRIRLSKKNLERLTHIPPGGGFESLPMELRAACHRAGAAKIGHRSVYGRLDPNKPAGTITARFDSFTRGRFAHPMFDRNITLREGARLQTFPDSFVFTGTQEEVAAQIGNAVPPLLARRLGEAVRTALLGNKKALPSRQLSLGFEAALSA